MPSPEIPAIVPADESPVAGGEIHFHFDNSYARLPERFYARVNPTTVPAPALVKLNFELARELGLDPERLSSREGVEVLAGNRIAEGSDRSPWRMPGTSSAAFTQLGDGRAILLGE